MKITRRALSVLLAMAVLLALAAPGLNFVLAEGGFDVTISAQNALYMPYSMGASGTVVGTYANRSYGAHLTFPYEAKEDGVYAMTLRQAFGRTELIAGKGETIYLSVYDNGNFIKELSFPITGSWSTFADVDFELDLTKGKHYITFWHENTKSCGGPNIDYLKIQPQTGSAVTLQAESVAAYQNGGMGWDGKALAGFYKNRLAAAQFTIENVPADGYYTVSLTFQNGNPEAKNMDAKLAMIVNGEYVQDTLLPPQTSWSVNAVKTETVYLKAGSNTIRYWRFDMTLPNPLSPDDQDQAAPNLVSLQVKSHTHTPNAGVVTAPTCTEDGYTTYTCTDSNCGAVWKDNIIPAAHKWDAGTVTKQPTCTNEGVRLYICTVDGTHTKEEPVAPVAANHKWNEGTVTKEASCTETGVMQYVCKENSSHIREQSIAVDANAHKWDEGIVTKRPTCSVTGIRLYTCTLDPSHTKEEPVPVDANAHSDENNDGYCDGCGTQTCAHQYTETVVAPTCENKGYTTHTCKNCSYSYSDQYVDAIGHNWNAGTVIKEATCSTTGIRLLTCQNDPDHTKEEVIDKAPGVHKWDASTVTKEATCSATGTRLFTCAYNSSHTKAEQIAIDADAHKWDAGTLTKEATCAQTGTKAFTCQHNSAHTKTEDVPVDPEAHKWDAGTVVKEPTFSEDGIKRYICQNDSSHTKDESISAKGAGNSQTMKDHNAAVSVFQLSTTQTVVMEAEYAKWHTEDASKAVGEDRSHGGYSGTGFVAGLWCNPGAAVEYPISVPKDGTYIIKLRYANGAIPAAMGLYLDGQLVEKLSLSSTNAWNNWGEYSINIKLTTQNKSLSVVAEPGSGQFGANLDYVSAAMNAMLSHNAGVGVFTIGNQPAVMEAEKAIWHTDDLNKTVGQDRTHPGYSGSGFVAGLWNNPGSYVEFPMFAERGGTYVVSLRYANGAEPAPVAIYLDGKLVKKTELPGGGWASWMEYPINLNITSGAKTLRVVSLAADEPRGINLDLVRVELNAMAEHNRQVKPFQLQLDETLVMEAEDAKWFTNDISKAVGANKEHTGYTGTGFVAGMWCNPGATVLFPLDVQEDGTYRMSLRYANGANPSSVGIYVDGELVAEREFVRTGTWSNWSEYAFEVDLTTESKTMTVVALYAPGEHGINLDHITVQPPLGIGPITDSDAVAQTPAGEMEITESTNVAPAGDYTLYILLALAILILLLAAILIIASAKAIVKKPR